jgi:hypothetical protein
MDAFDKHEYLSVRKEHFQLAIPTIAPRRDKAIGYDINQLNWNEVKFLNDAGELHDDMSSIPNDVGGIYIFRIKSDILPNIINYTMYIGRAQYNNGNYSLRARCRRYKNDPRMSIRKMIKYWGPYLYVSYTTLSDNELIVDLEKFLIASVLPVYNPAIDEVEVKEAKRMFYP